jgi:hypothetical protein
MRAKGYITSLIFTVTLIACSTSITIGQTNKIGVLLKSGANDAQVLTKAYLAPLEKGIGTNLNTGWFTSASTHKFLGFDIQIHGVATFIPSSGRQFNIGELNLEKTTLADEASPITPTVNGNDVSGSKVIVTDKGKEVDNFRLPQGSGIHLAPTPMIQASLGLIKKTDLILRFVPKVQAGDYGNFRMKGIGFKHSISQWLPGGKLFPVDIAVAVGYNHVRVNGNLKLKPDPTAAPNPDHRGGYNNQKVKDTFDTFTAQLVVGKDFPFVSLFAAGGYVTSSMHLAVTGDYPIVEYVDGARTNTTLTDPFSYRQTGADKFNLTGGLTIRLSVFHIFGQYTLARQSTANAGIGFSFR